MTTLASMVDRDLQSLIDAVLTNHHCDDDRQLWQTLVELGLADLTGSEDRGGSGASFPEAAALARALARHGCALQVAESDLVAGWLLEQSGAPPRQALRIALLDDAHVNVPNTSGVVERAAVLRRGGDRYHVSDVPLADVGTDVDDGERYPVTPEILELARTRRALVRAIQISATLETVTELTIEYAQTREQFGRAIGKQQAVQRMVALIAGETALARAATDAAVLAASDTAASAAQVAAKVAVARSCCGHAVDPVIRNAHQVVGAIGTTREHPLHVFTSAALALRAEDRTTREWDAAVLDLTIQAQPLSDLELMPVRIK
ncbi:acyl-CoA dehydrogenase family protein [Mycolicibacterium goodii]|uniref:Acyl-CoA dehydrogenase n=1 Tax=Mycolicibacterium goodii TaxID=134601 RepID=A0A0K0XA32_MYCGD|nr:acyl-CoA dehydrogenase [Mycolicibacterium goodii]